MVHKSQMLQQGGSGSVVNSVTNIDGSLTISPRTGNVIASLNTANSNNWTGKQTFNGESLATSAFVNPLEYTMTGA